MGIRISQVDAFTKTPIRRQPRGRLRACRAGRRAVDAIRRGRDEPLRDGIRQATGRRTKFSLRWFTPVSEVDLCGHATLATAHILWEEGHLPHGEPALFETRSGLLTARPGPDGIELDFPAEPVSETNV